MITLDTTKTLAGVASVASQLTVTVTGMELASSTETYKQLYQGQLPNAAATLYTVPAATVAFIRSIHVANNDASARTFQLFVGGTAAANALFPAISIPAGGFAYFGSEGWQVFNSSGATQIASTPSGTAGGDLTGTYPNPTVTTDAITFAKMQNVATDSLIGRDTAGTGDPENILLNATLGMDGSGNLQRAALTGDVTAPVGSNATTIANDAVTYAKMQNVSATSRVLGRITAGSGDPEELTAANLKTIAGYYTSGDSPSFAAITGTGLLDISGASAGQVSFPAAQNAAAGANVLDDYEEGTFTPALAFVTVGTSTWAINNQLGWYTKIGNVVVYTLFYSGVPTNGTAAGALNLTGLPFTAKGTTNEQHANACELQGYTKANFTAPILRILQGTTTAEFRVSGSAQSTAQLVVADIPTGGTVIVRSSGIYMTAS